MPTKPLKPLPRPLRYLQPFVRKLAKLGPEGHRREVDAGPLDAALRQRVDGLERRSAESALRGDRDLLATWLATTGGPDHPAYWVAGYLSGAGLVTSLRRPPPKPKPRPKRPWRSAVAFEAPDGWTVRPGAWRLDLTAKGVVGSIDGMDQSEYADALRLLKHARPAPRSRGAPKVTSTAMTVRRGGCSGKKYVRRWPGLALPKQVHYVLRVPGGGVTIVLDGTSKGDFDESPLEAKLHTLRVRRRRRRRRA